jgi:membrane protease YdiL (CAAX protease family)
MQYKRGMLALIVARAVAAGAASPPNGTRPDGMLRFRVGTEVLCNMGMLAAPQWAPGRVVDLNCEKPTGQYHPYQVKLECGTLIFAPQDIDTIIKAANPSAADSNKRDGKLRKKGRGKDNGKSNHDQRPRDHRPAAGLMAPRHSLAGPPTRRGQIHSLTQERVRPQGHAKGEVKGQQGRVRSAAAAWDERDAPVAIPGSVGQVVVRGVLGYVATTFAYQTCLDMLVACRWEDLVSPAGLLWPPALFFGSRYVWRATTAALCGQPVPAHGSVPWFDVALLGSASRSTWGWLAWPAGWVGLLALSGPDYLFPTNLVLDALSRRRWSARFSKFLPGSGARGEQVPVSRILSALRDPSARGRVVLASLLLNVCLLSPVVEEFFFRGFLIPALVVRGLSGRVAILTSAIVFAVVHLNPSEIDHVWFGVMCGVAYANSGTLLAPIAMHVLINGSIIHAHLRASAAAVAEGLSAASR